MDPHRPFTFLDDRLVAGDALLGIGNTATLPGKAARDLRVERDLTEARDLRRQLAALPDRLEALAEKRRLLDRVREVRKRADAYADLVVGAQLASVKRGQDPVVIAEKVGALAQQLAGGGDVEPLEAQARSWLAIDQPVGGFDRDPLHWPLEFPEVFDRGGFDAIIGNPPFLGGQKLTGALGPAYRELLISGIGRKARGSADLVAYFLLRAHDLLNPGGQTGLIATNTLAQGDTREVGLDQVVSRAIIRQSIKSRPWPSQSAALEFCAVWTSRAALDPTAERRADGLVVTGITPSLDPESRATGNPYRLAASQGIAYKGIEVTAIDGFTMSPDAARVLIEASSENSRVLFPFLNGSDLNSRPDSSASRWIINFHDWTEVRAKDYPECYRQLFELVRPVLLLNNNPSLREYWWRYKRPAPAMQAAVAGLERVIVITLVSRTAMPVMVPTGQVFSHMLGVFAIDDTAMLAVLSSAPHYWWAASRASSLKADLRYTPSDVFETFALPELTPELRGLGNLLDAYRRDVMLSRQAGLTATYNLVFDPRCQDDDIVELRRIHRDIDVAVCRAYGWIDLIEQGLDHEFHKAGAYLRYTVGPDVQREILDRLLELNHQRYAEEVAQGLHDKKKAGRKTQSGPATLF